MTAMVISEAKHILYCWSLVRILFYSLNHCFVISQGQRQHTDEKPTLAMVQGWREQWFGECANL